MNVLGVAGLDLKKYDRNREIRQMMKSDRKLMEAELASVVEYMTGVANATLTADKGLGYLHDVLENLPAGPDSMVEKGFRGAVLGPDVHLLEKELKKWRKFLDIRNKVIAQGVCDLVRGTNYRESWDNMFEKMPVELRLKTRKLFDKVSQYE